LHAAQLTGAGRADTINAVVADHSDRDLFARIEYSVHF